MAKKSIAKNYIYNLIYQMLTIILPFITIPYLSRVLGADSIGVYGYTISIVTYFILIGTLGVSMYGQREIAYYKDNETKSSKIFYEIVIFRTITLCLSIILFYLLYCRKGDFSLYYKILIIQLIANIFDISWFFQGREEFSKTVVRNLIVKIISLILIFILIKSPNDLWKYFLIFVLSELLGNVSLWLYLPSCLKKVELKKLELKKHFKPILALFIPQVAIQIYTVLDKTMIGVITNNMSDVGFYEQAQKIVKATITIIWALQTVMNSRIANAYANNDKKEIKECLEKSFKFVWLIGVPMMFGIIAISEKFVPWYYGSGYEKVIPLLMLTSPIIIIIGLNGITGVQYLVQIGKQKIFTISVFLGAITNFCLNIILINMYGSIGATIASVIAEIVILLFEIRFFKEQFNLIEIIKLGGKCIISGLIMFGCVFVLMKYLDISVINTLIEVLLGVIIYVVVLKILKYPFLDDLINQVNNMLKKGKKVKNK